MAIDFFRIQKGLTLTPKASAPSSPTNGDIYYDSTLHKLRLYANGAWVELDDSATGDVQGPASATDEAICRFDLTTGKLIQNSAVTLSDAGVIAGATIDGDANTLQDIGISSLKTVLGDASKFIARDAAGAVVSVKAVPVGDVVGSSDNQTLTNKTIDADSNTISNIANAQIKAAAAIDLSKLAALTASRALVSDGSGVISASSVTGTELSYLSGVGSSIQTQIDALVEGPTSAADNSIPVFDGTTGKLIKDNNIATLSAGGLTITTAGDSPLKVISTDLGSDSQITDSASTTHLRSYNQQFSIASEGTGPIYFVSDYGNTSTGAHFIWQTDATTLNTPNGTELMRLSNTGGLSLSQGNLSVIRAEAGGNVDILASNSASAAGSNARLRASIVHDSAQANLLFIRSGGATYNTNWVIGIPVAGTSLQIRNETSLASGITSLQIDTDNNVTIPNGTLTMSGGDIYVDRANSGGAVFARAYNSSTDANSYAFLEARTAGTSGTNDAYVSLQNDARTYIFGIDGSDSDKFRFMLGSGFGATEAYNITSGGDITISNGDLTVSTGVLRMSDGTESLPAITFVSDPDTGFYRNATNGCAITAGGARCATFTGAAIGIEDGAVGAPAIYFRTDSDNGIFLSGSDNWDLVAGGSSIVSVRTTNVTVTQPLLLSDNVANLAEFTRTTDNNAGIVVGGSVDQFWLGADTNNNLEFREDNSAGQLLMELNNASGDIVWKDGAATTKGFYIQRQVSDGLLSISSSTGSNSGANLIMYGNTHATNANEIYLRQSSTNVFSIAGGGDITVPAGNLTVSRAEDAGNVFCNLINTGSDSASTVARYKAEVQNDNALCYYYLRRTGSASKDADWFLTLESNTTDFQIGTHPTNVANQAISITTGLNITFPNGYIGIGTTNSNYHLRIESSSILSGTAQSGIGVSHTVNSSGTGTSAGFYSRIQTANSAFTAGVIADFYSETVAKGAACTVGRRVTYGAAVAPTDGDYNAFLTDYATNFTGDWGLYINTDNPSIIKSRFKVGRTDDAFGDVNSKLQMYHIETGSSTIAQSWRGMNIWLEDDHNNVLSAPTRAGAHITYERDIGDDVTDTVTYGISALIAQLRCRTTATKTYTYTDTDGWANVRIPALALSDGTVAISEYKKIYVEQDTGATGTFKYGLFIGNQSGATNNYAIYTGSGPNSFGGYIETRSQADPGAPTNAIRIGSIDTAGESTATLALRTEQAVEAIGTFTASHKLKININGTEYWVQLDQV